MSSHASSLMNRTSINISFTPHKWDNVGCHALKDNYFFLCSHWCRWGCSLLASATHTLLTVVSIDIECLNGNPSCMETPLLGVSAALQHPVEDRCPIFLGDLVSLALSHTHPHKPVLVLLWALSAFKASGRRLRGNKCTFYPGSAGLRSPCLCERSYFERCREG